jgi:hypothetical protein
VLVCLSVVVVLDCGGDDDGDYGDGDDDDDDPAAQQPLVGDLAIRDMDIVDKPTNDAEVRRRRR